MIGSYLRFGTFVMGVPRLWLRMPLIPLAAIGGLGVGFAITSLTFENPFQQMETVKTSLISATGFGVIFLWMKAWKRRRSAQSELVSLTPSQREQVERRIAEFHGEASSIPAHADVRGAVARSNALPLLFDWTALMALRPDGQIVWVPYDDVPGVIEVIRDERLRNMGLFKGTKLHPELQFLLPRRPADAIACPDCRGRVR